MWYFKGRRKKYKSPYTGKEVDEAVKKSADTSASASEIDTAVTYVNSLTATANELDAAATYVGSLTSTAAEVDAAVAETKKKKYIHRIKPMIVDRTFDIITDTAEAFTLTTLNTWLTENGYTDITSADTRYPTISNFACTQTSTSTLRSLTISQVMYIAAGTTVPVTYLQEVKIDVDTTDGVSFTVSPSQAVLTIASDTVIEL